MPKKTKKKPTLQTAPSLIVSYKQKVEAQSVLGRWTSLFRKKGK